MPTSCRSATPPRSASRHAASASRRDNCSRRTPNPRSRRGSAGAIGTAGAVRGSIDTALLVGASVLLIAVAAVRLSARAGLPSVLVYLALGVAIGESGLGIQFSNADLTRVLGFCALVVIIAEGGLTTRWSVVRPVMAMAATLATFGVFVSVAVVGTVVHVLLDL